MPGIGVPDATVLLAETLGKTSRYRSSAGLLRRPGTSDQEIGLIDPWRGASPTAATRGSSAPCSPPHSPHCALTPSPGPTTGTNAIKANRLGLGRPRLGPPSHPDPARHDPQRRPQQPTAINTATRSRLTHHIGAPSRDDFADPLTISSWPQRSSSLYIHHAAPTTSSTRLILKNETQKTSLPMTHSTPRDKHIIFRYQKE